MYRVVCGHREVPEAAEWTVRGAAPQWRIPRVLGRELVCPLPDVTDKILDSEGRRTGRMRIHIICGQKRRAILWEARVDVRVR